MDIMAIDGLGDLLKIVISLALLYWLLATVSSFILESISSLMNVRGNALRQFAIDMIQGEIKNEKGWWIFSRRFPTTGWLASLTGKIDLSDPSIHRFAASLFDHSLMKSLEQPLYRRGSRNVAPSYVPSTTFAQTIIDRLLDKVPIDKFLDLSAIPAGRPRADTARAFNAVLTELQAKLDPAKLSPEATGYEAVKAALAIVLDLDCGKALEAALAITAPTIVAADATNIDKAAAIADAFLGGPNGPLSDLPPDLRQQQAATFTNVAAALTRRDLPVALKEALHPLVQSANHDLDALNKSIATWYDQSMQRAGGWYRRAAVNGLLFLGLVAAVLLNIDTLRIADALVNGAALRNRGQAAATQVVAAGNDTARQAIPAQLAFIDRAKQFCAPETSGAFKCDKPDKEKGREKVNNAELEKLVFLTAAPGSAPGLYADYLLAKRVEVSGAQADFVARIQKRCKAEPARCAVPADFSAVANDPKLFWYPGLVETLFISPKTRQERGDKLADALSYATASAGNVSSFIESLPSVGPVWTVARTENWAAQSGLSCSAASSAGSSPPPWSASAPPSGST